jgi:sensor histidine kinase YesM
MKINKELKYNILVIVTLIVLDFGWDIFMSNKRTLPLSHAFLLTMTYSISFFSVYLINYYYFLPKLLDAKKYLTFILSIILMILSFAGIRFLLEEVILLYFFNIHNYNLEPKNIVFIYLFDSFIYAFKACLYSSVTYLVYKYNENKNKLHQLNIEHQQAQLATLKSQISPHFLFNTLNSFYVELHDEKPETAKDILKLSQLLRYVTYEASQDVTLLQKEIEFIEDYLYFFKRRYEDNFHVHLNVKGVVSIQQIPALILIHFIENVCKHGIINDKSRPAKIEITILKNTIEISTENYINTSEKYMENGIGTKNIKKRLEVIYKDNYTLQYQKNETIFKSYLKLPL